MVSISFGKSNFSKAQNSYQMTISLIMMVIVMCAVSSIITMTKMNESPSKPTVKPDRYIRTAPRMWPPKKN